MTGITIGFGDSQTLSQMGLYERLKKKNIVYDPAQTGADNDAFLEMAKHALQTEVLTTSVNALSEDGIIVNLDGTGNRVAGSLFRHRKVFYVIGRNKVAQP